MNMSEYAEGVTRSEGLETVSALQDEAQLALQQYCSAKATVNTATGSNSSPLSALHSLHSSAARFGKLLQLLPASSAVSDAAVHRGLFHFCLPPPPASAVLQYPLGQTAAGRQSQSLPLTALALHFYRQPL